MMSKAFNGSVMLYVFMVIIDLSQSYPSSEYSNSNSLSASSEEVPTFSIKVNQNPISSETTYEDSSPLCKSQVVNIDPNDLIRQRGFDVINNPRFKQTITVEECSSVGDSCNNFMGQKTECRQRFMSIQLRVFDKKTNSQKMESFIIPSACECAFLSLSKTTRSPNLD